MKYLKENKTTVFTYLDFLKTKDKIQIDGETSPVHINTAEGLADIHPNVEHLEIGNTEIPDVSDLSRMKHLEVLMLYKNDKLRSINGLNGLTLSNLTLMDLKSLNSLGKVAIIAKKVVFSNCPNFKPNIEGISGIEELDITKCGTLKDLTFLKDREIRKIDFRETSIDSLYGIQYSQDTKLSFNNMNQTNHRFEYHRMFYNDTVTKSEQIVDYWKQIVDYWINVIEKGKTTILELSHEDIKETFIDGIKLPKEEIERLFNDEEKRYIKSVSGISKYNL